ncbi:alpha-2 collagen [Apostichopus japonicus]|uniref:Alpha-2 collagen n=1 Tax=Stichopus japonicus TaxID=307972 RepID=A0A2G8LKC8_STIJA|nr:alpha-2 collagen [Apostichopus japonicus]
MDFKKKEPFGFSDVAVEFDGLEGRCGEFKFVCTRLERGDAPVVPYDLGFNFNGFPTDRVLTDCDEITDCRGSILNLYTCRQILRRDTSCVLATGLSWRYSGIDIIAGMENPLNIVASSTFTQDSTPTSGTGLWRLGLYGSTRSDGSGPRFNYVDQVLTEVEAAIDYVGTKIDYNDGLAMFDVAAIGCTEYVYACMEFTKGSNPNPDFYFGVIPEGDILTLCKESECLANVLLTSLSHTVESGEVNSQTARNPLTLRVQMTARNVGVAGEGLWRLKAFGSRNDDGSGERIGEVNQVLTPEQQGETLFLDRPTVFEEVDFNLNMRNRACNEAKFICVEIMKGDNPSTVFKLIPHPDESVMISCVPNDCTGVVASGLSWVYRADNVIAGIENPISISGEVTFTDESSQVFGDYLWRLGLFGSQFEDGSGERFNYVSQVLDDTEGSYDLISQKLTFTNGAAMFDVAAIGCTEFVYGCMEFTKSLNASTDFQFSILPSGDVLTLCKESPCLANVKVLQVQNTLMNGALDPYTNSNPIRMKVSVTGAEVGVAGQGLWRLRAFGSNNRDGSGTRYSETLQVLNPSQQNQMLGLTDPMVFKRVNYNLDASEIFAERPALSASSWRKALNQMLSSTLSLYQIPL